MIVSGLSTRVTECLVRISIYLTMASSLFWCESVCRRTQADEKPSTILSEYRSRLKELKSSLPHLNAVLSVGEEVFKSGADSTKTEMRWTCRYQRDPLFLQVESLRISPPSRTLVRSVSPAGYFEIQRLENEPRYSLRHAGEHAEGRIAAALENYLSVVLCGWHVCEDIETLLDSPGTTVSSVSTRDDGNVVVRLGLDPKTFYFMNVEFSVSPRLGWRVVEGAWGSDFASKEDNEHYRQVLVEIACEYVTVEGSIVPKRVMRKDYQYPWSSADGLPNLVSQSVYDFHEYKQVAIDESQFLLSRFGLPDHVARAPDPGAVEVDAKLLWLAGAVLGVVALTVISRLTWSRGQSNRRS